MKTRADRVRRSGREIRVATASRVLVVFCVAVACALSTRLSGLPFFPLALAIGCGAAAIALTQVVHFETRNALCEQRVRSSMGAGACE
ncbi:MAG TPA: hypothetical protein VLA56_20780 [Pseudomonadales bacterium]|nr:hypothetical protein [Pseudomonadales bacterium]